MDQQQQPQGNEQRLEQLRTLLGLDAFCIAYTLQADGFIEALKITEASIAPEGQAIPVKLTTRAWRLHHLGVDTFLSLPEAVHAASKAREEEIKALQGHIEALTAITLKAPTEKVKEAEEKQAAEAAQAAQAQAAQNAMKLQASSLLKKSAVKKPAVKKTVVKK